jgi:hypothetical protein
MLHPIPKSSCSSRISLRLNLLISKLISYYNSSFKSLLLLIGGAIKKLLLFVLIPCPLNFDNLFFCYMFNFWFFIFVPILMRRLLMNSSIPGGLPIFSYGSLVWSFYVMSIVLLKLLSKVVLFNFYFAIPF